MCLHSLNGCTTTTSVTAEIHGQFVELWNLREDELPLRPSLPKMADYQVEYFAIRVNHHKSDGSVRVNCQIHDPFLPLGFPRLNYKFISKPPTPCSYFSSQSSVSLHCARQCPETNPNSTPSMTPCQCQCMCFDASLVVHVAG
jgi:hypothetical protein